MEDAVDHRALERRNESRLQERVRVDARRVHRLDVVEREAVEPLHHQHPPADERGVRPRHDDPALLGLREDAGDVEHVLRFESEVELLDDRLREQLDQRRRIRQRRHRDAAHQAGREPGERGDVVAEALRDLRPLHLDHDLFAGAQPGRVHLGDRGRGDRRLVERLEQLLERTAEVDLHHCPHVGERLGRHLIAQQLELVDQLVGEEALAAGDDLAELHVARTEPFEGQPQPTGDPGTRRRPAPLEDQPPAERVPDLDQGAAEPAEGREPARREEPGHLAARAAPDAFDVPLPRDGVEIEHPRAAVAERAPHGVGGQRLDGLGGKGEGGIDGLDGEGHRQENAIGTPRASLQRTE